MNNLNNIITSVQKLNGSNFLSWATSIEIAFRSQNLWNIISEEGEWRTLSPNEFYLTLTILRNSMTEEILEEYAELTNPKELWAKISEKFDKKDEVTVVNLLQELSRIKLHDDTSLKELESYIKNFNNLTRQLKRADKGLGEKAKVLYFLNGLPQSMESLACSIKGWSSEKATVENVVECLMEHVKRNEERTVSEKNESVNFIKSKNRPQKQKKESWPPCTHCKRTNHRSEDCYFKNTATPGPNFQFSLNKDNLFYFWLFDGGASTHATFDKNDFIQNTFIEENVHITIPNGSKLKCTGYGDVKLDFVDAKNQRQRIILKHVKLIPTMKIKVISEPKILQAGFQLIKNDKTCTIKNSSNSFTIEVNPHNKFFTIAAIGHKEERINNIHESFGHASTEIINQGIRRGAFYDLAKPITNKNTCNTCALCKQTRKSVSSKGKEHAKRALESLHSDLWGPITPSSPAGTKYLLTITDEFSKYAWIFPIKEKSDTAQCLKSFFKYLENKYHHHPPQFVSDNGREFVTKDLQKYLFENGMHHKKTAPYHPNQNGLAERINQTLGNSIRCLLEDSKLQKEYWVEAATTAIYLSNRTPKRALNYKTPYEIMNGVKPKVSHLKPFGTSCYVKTPIASSKLEHRSMKGILLGFVEETSNYRILVGPKKVIISPDVIFTKDKFVISSESNERINIEKLNTPPTFHYANNSQNTFRHMQVTPPTSNSDKEDTTTSKANENSVKQVDEIDAQKSFPQNNDNEDLSSSPEPCNSEPNPLRNRKPINYKETKEYTRRAAQQPITTNKEMNLNQSADQQLADSLNIVEYTTELTDDEINTLTVTEALASDEKTLWEKAIHEEVDALERNETWNIIENSACINAIGSKIVLKKKLDSNGNTARYKARLVAQGFSQVEGINYSETFSPVINFNTVLLILVIACNRSWKVNHIDFETAFLNAELREKIYMRPPKQLQTTKKFKNKLLELKKSIYGLKQAGREWNKLLQSKLLILQWKQSPTESCLFTRKVDEKIQVLLIYVDDILVVTENETDSELIIEELSNLFKLKNLGKLTHFLNINFALDYTNKLITINQNVQINSILQKNNVVFGAKTPICNNFLDENYRKELQNVSYNQSLVGSLLHIARLTRPDILFGVSFASRRMTYNESNCSAILQKILAYLNSTKGTTLTLDCSETQTLHCYSDSDWGGDREDRHSTSGYSVFLGKAIIAYRSQKQPVIALSTMEAEYIALNDLLKESIYLHNVMNEILKENIIVNFYCDNNAAIEIIKNPKFRSRSKHIDIKFHYIREKYEEKFFEIHRVNSTNNPADTFTKPINSNQLHNLSAKLGLMKSSFRGSDDVSHC